MTVKLLTEHHLDYLILKGGCTSLPESTFVKMPHCWKSHVMAQIVTCSCFHYHMENIEMILIFYCDFGTTVEHVSKYGIHGIS